MWQESDLKRLHEGAIKNDKFISAALGPNAKIERMKAAALRLGSQGLRKARLRSRRRLHSS